jgi:hypothetical protein
MTQGAAVDRRRRAPQVSGLTALALVLMLLASGCSESGTHPTSTTAAHVRTTPTQTAVAAQSEPPLNSVAVLHLRSESGYTANAELRRGALEHAASQKRGSLTLGTACQVNSQTDAIVPFEITLTNTTSSYSASPGIEIVAVAPNNDLPHLMAEPNYAEGPQCVTFVPGAYHGDENTNGTDYLAVSAASPLAPGGSVTTPGFFIVHGYHSPAHPNGDTQLLHGVELTFQPQSGGEGFNVASASGVRTSQAVTDAVPFVPGGTPGCLIRVPCPPPVNVPAIP